MRLDQLATKIKVNLRGAETANPVIVATFPPTASMLLTATPTAVPSANPTVQTTQALSAQGQPVPLCRPASLRYCEVTASVRGNLSPVLVVLSPSVSDWMTDRWQAAKDLSGVPIPGKHWVLLDLKRKCHINKVVLDWETALASKYELLASEGHGKPWTTLYSYSSAERERETSPKHIVHTLQMPPAQPAQLIKLVMLQLGTRFGASLWRFDVIGHDT
jgi:hypothetical protein